VAQLFLAIAAHEAARRAVRRMNERRVFHALAIPARLLDLRQLTLDAIAESGVVRFVGHDDVETRDVAQTSKQIEVRRPQATRVRRVLRARNDDVIERERGLSSAEPAPQHVLVELATRLHGALVAEEGESEKTRLVDQSFAAAIGAALDS